MSSSSKDSSGGPGAATEELQGSQYAGYCAGLEPVLEAVDELPPSGSPIPPSAQGRVRQFLTQQLSTGTTAAVQALCVRPKDLQDIKQLLELLQRHANHLRSAVEGHHGVIMPAAAAQLVADAVRQVARQQVVEKNSAAYSLLLDEGYRAGVMAVGCAGLKAQLGLRITTHTQLTRAIAVVVQAVAESVAFGAAGVQYRPEVTVSFAWECLKPYHSDSGRNSGSSGSCPWRPSHVDVLSRFVQVTESCMDLEVHDVLGTQVCNTLAAAAVNAVIADGPATSVAPNMPSIAAGRSSSGSRGPSAAAAAGSKGGAQKSAGSNQGSSASNASAMPQLSTRQMDMSLPLDDCPLLAAHCQLYGPVVAAFAGWASSLCQELPGGLRAAVKQCLVAQLAAAGSSSGRLQAYGGGKRRTIVPCTFPRSIASLSELQATMTTMLQINAKVSPGLQQVLSPLPQLLRAAVQEVAQKQAVEKNSPAFDTLIQAGLTAGCVAAACAGLHSELGVRLTTGRQLFEALKVSCVAVVAFSQQASGQQSVARTAYQDLLRITAAANSSSSSGSGSGSGGSTSASGSSGGGRRSCSNGMALAVPKCGWDVAFLVICHFAGSQVYMAACEGDMTEALAHAGSAWVVLESMNKGAFFSGGDWLQSALLGSLLPLMSQPGSGSGAAGSSSSTPAAAQGQEAESWGKGQGLAGLKGLFASKPAAAAGAAATPAAQPVAAEASSSTGKGTAAAPAAAAAAAGVNKAVAVAGTGSKARKSGSSNPGSKSASNASNASTAPQPPPAPLDMSLPLDECLLLAERCQLLGPVVAAVAGTSPGTAQQESGPLRAAGKGAAAASAAAAAAGAKHAAAAAGTSRKGSAKEGDSSSAGSLSIDRNMMQAPGRVIDMTLPLDDCPLLAAHCQLFEPVVVAVASLADNPTEDRCPTALGGPVLGAIMQCVAAKLAADGGSSGQQAYGGGRRRSVVPNLPPADVHSLDKLGAFMATMQLMLATVSTTLELVLAPLPDLVCVAVQEVARQQAVEQGPPAFDTLIQAALSAGAVAAGCAALQTELDIVLTTGQQLFEAVKTSCVALTKSQRSVGPVSEEAVQRSVAFNLYQDLLRITAAADSSSSSGGSSSGNGGRGGSASGSSSGPSVAMPKCDLGVAYSVICHSSTSLAYMRECEGDITEALVRADSSWTVVRTMLQSDSAAKLKAVLSQGFGALLSQLESGSGAAGSSSSSTPAAAAAQGQEGGGRGKGQGLAGLKGQFASKPAAAAGAAAAPASQPVAVKASSSGALVATSSAGKATASAAAAAAAVGAKVAAAALGNSAPANTATISFSSTTTSSSSSKATDTELLVEANLKSWYCSPDTFAHSVVVPLPQDSLQLLVKLQLHTKYRNHGWNALHYACASHRVELVKQLLAAGASASEPEDNALLQPLHLACMGEVEHKDEFFDMLEACEGFDDFKQHVSSYGVACAPLVDLLLTHGADYDAQAGLPGSELEGLTPLHILSCWHGEEGERDRKLVFGNPWVGKAFMVDRSKPPLPPAVLLCQAKREFDTFAATGRSLLGVGERSLLSPGLVDGTLMFPAEEQVKVTSSSELMAEWGEDLSLAVQHVGAVRALLDAGASPDVQHAGLLLETPLMIAAQRGNAAVTAALMYGHADPELMRADGARALEIAADERYPIVGWTLLCGGAQALPSWVVSGRLHPWAEGVILHMTPLSLSHQMLVCNAVQCQTYPWNCFFLQRLLADGVGLEERWPETGETPLLMAISYLDLNMVCMLVEAGADVNAKMNKEPHEEDTAIALLLFHTVKDKPGLHPNAKQILQVLIDAGADLHSYRNVTDYDLVQTAANRSDMDAALKLVEAGCKWQLPKGQRVLGGSVYYAPEILTTNIPNLKLAYVEGRFRLAEKVGRQKRAAIATALQPWLSPDVTPACKDATLRCLVAAGVTPGNPHTRPLGRLASAPSPRVKARWAGVQAQRAAASAAAGGSAGQQGSGTQPGARQGSAAVDDIDALLEEIESVGVKEPSAGGSKGAAKRKKKETAAQREARQKQLQRARQLQGGGSSSDSEGEGEGRGSRDAGGSLSAAGAAEAVADAADMQAGSGAAGPGDQLNEQEAMAAPSDVPPPTQQQTTQKQQEQQQARASSSDAAAAPAGEADAQGPAMQPPRQQPIVAPPPAATAVPAAAALKAATTGGVQQQAAGLLTPGEGTVQQPQQQGVAVVPQGAPVTPPAAPAAVPTAAPQAKPSPVAMRPAAFLPPHLRISMPAAPAAGGVPAAGGAGAPVQVPAVLPVPHPTQAVPQVVHPVAMQPPPQPAAQHHLLQEQQQQQLLVQERQQGSALQQRMVELAKQHQLQQQAAQQGAPASKQQQQPSGSAGFHVPAVPHAMMDLLLSSSAQHTKAAAGRTGHVGHAAAAGSSSAARAAQQPSGAKRQPPAVAAHSAGQATVQAQQHGRTPAAVGKAAAGTAAGDAGGGKGPKLCLVCAQRRRNVLLIPCRHLVLCAECAEQLHGEGQLSSCPHCKKPCKQHIRVHQS